MSNVSKDIYSYYTLSKLQLKFLEKCKDIKEVKSLAIKWDLDPKMVIDEYYLYMEHKRLSFEDRHFLTFNKINNEIKKEIITLHNKYFSQFEISLKTNIKRCHVCKILKENKYKPRIIGFKYDPYDVIQIYYKLNENNLKKTAYHFSIKYKYAKEIINGNKIDIRLFSYI